MKTLIGTDYRLSIEGRFIDSEITTKVISKRNETKMEVQFIYHPEVEPEMYGYMDALNDVRMGYKLAYSISNPKIGELESQGFLTVQSVEKEYRDCQPVTILMTMVCE